MSARLDQVTWVANLHTMFREVPLLERPRAARAAGFTHVEFWWPFDGRPRPDRSAVEEFVEEVAAAEVVLTAMNLYAGTMADGDRGVVSHPDEAEDFRDSVSTAMEIGEALGTRLFNVPYGRRLPGVADELQDAAAVEALAHAARAAEAIGATILVEPLSGFDDYPVRTSRAAVEVVERVRSRSRTDNVGVLMDQYHLATNGQDVLADLEVVMPFLRHVQLADVPDRGAPGTGQGDVLGFVESLLDRGYDGPVALEYIPAGSTEESVRTWRSSFGLA